MPRDNPAVPAGPHQRNGTRRCGDPRARPCQEMHDRRCKHRRAWAHAHVRARKRADTSARTSPAHAHALAHARASAWRCQARPRPLRCGMCCTNPILPVQRGDVADQGFDPSPADSLSVPRGSVWSPEPDASPSRRNPKSKIRTLMMLMYVAPVADQTDRGRRGRGARGGGQHSAQPQHTNYWAPRPRKRHQQEHRPQWPTEHSDPTQHAKGRTGDCPGPRKKATTRRNVTQGGRRGPGPQGANPGAPAAQRRCSSAPRGSSTHWATAGAPEAPCGKEWWARQGKEPPTKPGVGAEPRTTARSQCSANHPGHHAGAHAARVTHEAHAPRNQQGTRPGHAQPAEWGSVCGGRPGQRAEKQGTWASRTPKRSQAGCGRPEDGGVWAAKTVKRPPQQPAQPPYATYWVPMTRKRHILPHPAQPRHTNHWAPRTRKRHQQEQRPQWPTEHSDPTQHAKGRTGDGPGPRKGATTRRNVTQGGQQAPMPRHRLAERVTVQAPGRTTMRDDPRGASRRRSRPSTGPHAHPNAATRTGPSAERAAEGRTGDCPGPRKETNEGRNVTRGGGGGSRVAPKAGDPTARATVRRWRDWAPSSGRGAQR